MTKATQAIICLTLILTFQAGAQGLNTSVSKAAPEDRFSAQWRMRLSGTDSHDEQTQSKIVDIRLDVPAQYRLSESLSLGIHPLLRLQSGQTQSVDGANKAENKISLYEAALKYAPLPQFQAAAGALNQRALHTEILVDSLAFPGARAEAALPGEQWKLGLALETAIPTSSSLSTNTRSLEPTPSLNTAALRLAWENSRRLYWKSSVGYFVFNNLPSTVAQQSQLLGNEVNALSQTQYEFVYNYEGLEAATELSVPLGRSLFFNVGAEYLINQKAPSDVNTATRYYAGSEIYYAKGKSIILEGSYFSVAPEAAVAYFTETRYDTNRIGYGLKTVFSFKKERFDIGAIYTDAEVMYTNAIQSREKTLMLKLETFYADL